MTFAEMKLISCKVDNSYFSAITGTIRTCNSVFILKQLELLIVHEKTRRISVVGESGSGCNV